MAVTDFGQATELQVTAWDTEISTQGRDANFFLSNGFVSRNTKERTKPIQRVNNLTKTSRGVQVVLPLVRDLSVDSGIVGDNELENNETALIADSQTMRIDQLRNGVKSQGRMAEQETVIRFRAQGREKLAFWLADVLDELMFLTVQGRAYTLNTDGSTRGASQLPSLSFAADVVAASTNRIKFAGTATTEATLTAADTTSWDLIVETLAVAKRKRLTPIRAGGKPYYVLVLSTEQCRDLEKDADYKSIQSQAMPRGENNPLFTNAKKIVNGVVIYDHPKVFNTLGLASASKWGAGGLIDGAQAILMGAQALGYAQLDDGSPGYEENALNDYKNRPGMGFGRIVGFLKPQYPSKYDSNTTEDFGTIAVKTAAAA